MKTKNINISKRVLSNLLWRFGERIGAQGVTFIISIVLSRLLDPAVYGITALVSVFTSILGVFIDSGLGSALIQKKDADDLDFSSVFYFNFIMCIILYIVMFFASVWIANFYKMPELVLLVRIMSLTLIISGVNNIQQAYVSRQMLFKKFFFSTLGGTIGAAGIGIWMAWRGYGVWALVIQGLFNSMVDTIILWITVKWRPKCMFSLLRLKMLLSFGWKLLASSLIDTIYKDLRQLIIGKLYSTQDLAFYNKGTTFPRLIMANINSSIDSVLFPTMSAAQDDKYRVRDMTRRAIKTSTYLLMPLMMGLAVCAKPLICLLLTDKWEPAVFFIRIFCLIYVFYPIHTANLNAIKAMGRSDLFLKLEIIKKVIGLIVLTIAMFISVKAMALSALFTSIVGQIINAWPNRVLLDYKYFDQVKDMLPQIIASCFMGGIVYTVTFLHLNNIIILCVQIPLGFIIYLLISKFFRLESCFYVENIITSFFQKTYTK